MYEVMARRYRPATFDAVVGQEHIAATLKNAIARDRVAHAFVFTGGHGCGKTTMARILAKALVCEKGPTPEPCGVCPICVDVAAGRDSDVLEIDGASNNGIEQIRQLREQAAYVPTRARCKIYIIDEVHMLSDGAFNALLKTLEEPPRHVKFILATTDPHKIPDTILSRCQRFDFRLVPPARLSAFFRELADREHAAVSDEALAAVAAFAEGSVRDGLVLLDQLLSFADGEVTRQDVEAVRGVASAENVAGVFAAIAKSDVVRALAIVDEVASRGVNTGDFLDQLVSFGRDLMIAVASGSSDGVVAYGPARETLRRLGENTSLESALLYLDVLAQARTRVRARALSNPLVALEMAVARLAGLGGVTPLAEIMTKLDELPAVKAPAGPLPDPPAQSSPPPPPEAEPPREKSPPLPSPSPPPPPPPPTRKPEPEPTRESPPEPPRVPSPPPPSAPAAPSGPPAAAMTMESVAPLWERILDLLGERHPADLRHMARVELENVEGGKIILAAPPAVAEAWEDKRRRERLGAAAKEVLGREAEFGFIVRKTARRNAESDSEARFRLSRHPTVEKVKSLFDGIIMDCRPAELPFSDGGEESGDEGDG